MYAQDFLLIGHILYIPVCNPETSSQYIRNLSSKGMKQYPLPLLYHFCSWP